MPKIALTPGDEDIFDNIFADALSGIDEQISGKTTDIDALRGAAQSGNFSGYKAGAN